ncbi:helix-turn-helix domain-containing protein [Streptomyces sp. WAC 04229]|uniref:helix-turn-helix domain-containing protein n=1 Tax=Streptomyces sp. WAC 04229 TaxID=2203206 RepID=UPI003D75FADB
MTDISEPAAPQRGPGRPRKPLPENLGLRHRYLIVQFDRHLLWSGMSRAELCDRAGITPSNLSRFLTGERLPSWDACLKPLVHVLRDRWTRLLLPDFPTDEHWLTLLNEARDEYGRRPLELPTRTVGERDSHGVAKPNTARSSASRIVRKLAIGVGAGVLGAGAIVSGVILVRGLVDSGVGLPDFGSPAWYVLVTSAIILGRATEVRMFMLHVVLRWLAMLDVAPRWLRNLHMRVENKVLKDRDDPGDGPPS